jgi:poly-beta-hydroxyalkanoate depolymerase
VALAGGWDDAIATRGFDLIYQAIEAARLSTRPLFHLLDTGQKLARHKNNPLRDTLSMRALAAAWELPARQLKNYAKPTYEVWEMQGDQEVPIHQEC